MIKNVHVLVSSANIIIFANKQLNQTAFDYLIIHLYHIYHFGFILGSYMFFFFWKDPIDHYVRICENIIPIVKLHIYIAS